MASLNDLRTAISGILALPAASGVLRLNSGTRERAFEAYVFALVLRAVRQAGGTAQLHGILSGANPNTVVLRGAPGHMGSRAQDFSYARCTLGVREFEVHVDVVYVGGSGASHEADISIYDRTAAEAVRRGNRVLPHTRSLRAAIECKFYDSRLGVALGRTFVGLVDDCGGLEAKVFATNGRSPPLAAYFSKKNRPHGFFGVSPLIPGNRDRLVGVIEQALREWAGVP